MNKGLVLVVVLLGIVILGKSQDTIVTFDGEKITAHHTSIKQDTHEIYYDNDKNKTKEIDYDDVFMLKDSIGKENVLYVRDTTKGNYETVENMRSMVEGQAYEREHYKAHLTTGAGAAIGFGSIAVATLTGFPIFFAPVISVIYSGTTSVVNPNHEKIKATLPPLYADNKMFLSGYVTGLKNKRLKNAIFGSVAGLAIGATSYLIYHSFVK